GPAPDRVVGELLVTAIVPSRIPDYLANGPTLHDFVTNPNQSLTSTSHEPPRPVQPIRRTRDSQGRAAVLWTRVDLRLPSELVASLRRAALRPAGDRLRDLQRRRDSA